jgi:hypothetical protein
MVVVGGIYSPNHFSSRCCRWAHRTVRWCTGHSTLHCPVSATSADRWGLGRLTIEVFCLLAALDSPMRSDFADWLLTSALQTACSQRSRPLDEVHRCSVVSTDSPMAHQTVQWILMDLRWENLRVDSSRGAAAWAPDSVWCATGCTKSCILQTL